MLTSRREDPLIGSARMISVTAALKKSCAGIDRGRQRLLLFTGMAANVAAGAVANGEADFIGYGRMVLSYPEFAADVLNGRTLQKNKICRTFSDCTTAPRLGLVSGCFPLDEYYRDCRIMIAWHAQRAGEKRIIRAVILFPVS